MKFRIVTGKQPETYDVEVDSGLGGFKKAHTALVSLHEAEMLVASLQKELEGKALWQPGIVLKEFE